MSSSSDGNGSATGDPVWLMGIEPLAATRNVWGEASSIVPEYCASCLSMPPADGITGGLVRPGPAPCTGCNCGDFPPADEWADAYGCCGGGLSFREDFCNFWGTLRDDSLGVINVNNLLILGAAAGGAVALRGDVDDDVRRWTAEHPDRWGKGSHVLGKFGDVPVQVPSLLALWGYSVWSQDHELHDFTETLISAYTVASVTTIIIKAAANTSRPSDTFNNGEFGFPSYHAASSFAIASVVDEYYGPYAGLPAYALAGLIGWSRIDERDHDLSDVVFGAALGYVVGKSVAGRHLYGDSRVQILPYVHPLDGSAGLMLDASF